MGRISIPKEELLSLIADSERLNALECGGVDNWSYYGESKRDYLKQDGTEDFEELAEKMLEEKLKNKTYRRVKAKEKNKDREDDNEPER